MSAQGSKPPISPESPDSKSVTGRAFLVLDAFDAEHRHQSLASIARRTGLPLTTCHRLVHELVARGALTRTLDGAYEIGSKIPVLGVLCYFYCLGKLRTKFPLVL